MAHARRFRPVPLFVRVAAWSGTVLALQACTGSCDLRRGGGGTGGAAALPTGAVPVPTGIPSPSTVGAETKATPPPAVDLTHAPVSFAPIAKRADPSVVTVNTVGEEVESHGILRGGGRHRELKGLGTGFIVDKSGIIVTNNHVIEGAGSITITLSDEKQFPAKVVGTDPATDIAVVRIEAKDLPVLPFGDSTTMDVGDWVVAIGNPFGLSHTVSAGIISAKGRTKDQVELGDPSGYYDFIQTDASINPGNSGGPLLNLAGEVIGINTAIRGGNAQNIGFAIPVNMLKQLLPMLLRDGHVTRSALGVRIRDVRELSPEDRATLKLESDKGAVIESVGSGGPADKAGLTPADVIVAFDGNPVERGTHLQWLASTAGVGRTVTLRVSRAGKLFDIKVTLGLLEDARRRK
ncbi:MAG: trypsin-like peptidase domain-containing protein [Polyangiaceae bacterium]